MARAFQAGQRVVDETMRPAAEADQDVAGGAEGVQRQRFAGQRVVSPHGADVAALGQPAVTQRHGAALRHQCGDGFRKVADGEIDVALAEQGARVAVEQRPHLDMAVCAQRLEPRHQRRQHQPGRGIGHGQTEHPRVDRRIELARLQRFAQLPQ